jgi:hypothetical protein
MCRRPTAVAGLALVCLALLAFVPTTIAAAEAKSVRAFDLRLRDAHCGQHNFCGTGTLTGFGRVTSISTFRPAGARPAPGCVNYKGTRVLTLVSDANSSVSLAVEGPACGHYRGWGTFRITSGIGAFGGARGSGVLLGDPLALHYYGVIVVI